MTSENIRSKIFYKQPYYKDKWGGFYIHFHGRDIGRIQKWVNYGDISQEFIAQKQSINTALKNQYTNLMLGNMTISQKSLGILNELLKKDYRDTFITQLDKYVKTTLQDQVNQRVLDSIHQLREHNQLYFRDSKTPIANQGEKGIERVIEELNKILKAVSTVINASKYKQDAKDITLKIALGSVTKNAGGTGYIPTLKNVGNIWNAQIEKINNLSKKGFWISLRQQNRLLDQLNILSQYFKDAAPGDDGKNYGTLTFNVIKGIFEQNISPKGIGEGFGIIINQKAQQMADLTVQEAISELKKIDNTIFDLPGDTNGQLYFSNVEGEYVSGDSSKILAGVSEDTITKGQNKTDTTEKIKFQVQSKDNGMSGEISYIVGISDKFYLDINMFNIKDKKEFLPNGNFTVSSSLPLGAMIKSTFKGQRLQYLAYNVLAWQDDSEEGNSAPNAIKALQECIFKRNIIHSMSSRSGPGSDFASYFLLNGKILSLWEIIDYALNSSDSRIETNAVSKEKGVSFQYNKTAITSIVSNRFNISMKDRIRKINAAIPVTKVNVHINPAKITEI